ncbi:MAG: hypothetical protein AAFP69_03230 [Planctomycetota bacterium]
MCGGKLTWPSLAMVEQSHRVWTPAGPTGGVAAALLGIGGIAVGTLVTGGTASAQDPGSRISTINQIGRLFGIGWGDGYHACAPTPDAFRSDLAPRNSYDPQVNGRGMPILGGGGGCANGNCNSGQLIPVGVGQQSRLFGQGLASAAGVCVDGNCGGQMVPLGYNPQHWAQANQVPCSSGQCSGNAMVVDTPMMQTMPAMPQMQPYSAPLSSPPVTMQAPIVSPVAPMKTAPAIQPAPNYQAAPNVNVPQYQPVPSGNRRVVVPPTYNPLTPRSDANANRTGEQVPTPTPRRELEPASPSDLAPQNGNAPLNLPELAPPRGGANRTVPNISPPIDLSGRRYLPYQRYMPRTR